MSELALQLIEENKRTKDTFLDLGNCSLARLPEELFLLTWLTDLNLGVHFWDKINERWIKTQNPGTPNWLANESLQQLSQLSKLQGLYLSANQFEDIHISFLSRLTQLQRLSLGHNRIEDIRFLKNLIQLQTLDLSDNRIEDVRLLGKLIQLQRLFVNHNCIEDIRFLENLPQLQTLQLKNNPIADIRILVNLTQLQRLDLGYNRIKDIHFLKNLIQLQTLDLSDNRIEDVRFLEGLTQLQSLNLSHNRIEDIRFLGGLTQLKSLDLNSNCIEDIRFLENLPQLQYLNLAENQIENTRTLGNLIQLQRLDLSSNRIADIRFLENLPQLLTLNLKKNQIKYINFRYIILNLQVLDLTENQIKHIHFPKTLSQLQILHLQNNQIKTIRFLGSLPQLHSLNLNSNRIADIRFLENLPQLRILHLQNNQIKYARFPKNLTKIQRLDLNNNQIENIYFPGNLPHLQSLDLRSNQIENIRFLRNLSQLQRLDLSSNRIEDARFLESLTQLLTLDLTENQIIEFSGKLIQAWPLLQLLLMSNNPIRNIPIDHFNRNKNALPEVRGYFASVRQGSIQNDEVKLIIVGNTSVGKTSLMRFIQEDYYEQTQDSTHGISLIRWSIPNLIPTLQVNIWDFGGQEYYHATHRLFLDDHAVYIVVWETSTNKEEILLTSIYLSGVKYHLPLEHFPYNYWLDSIRYYAPNSTVLLVQNKTLLQESGSEESKKSESKAEPAPTYCFKPTYNIYKPDYHISIYQANKFRNDPNSPAWTAFQSFKANLINVLQADAAGYKLGIGWVTIRNAIRLRSETQRWMTYSEFEEFCLQAVAVVRPPVSFDPVVEMSGLLTYLSGAASTIVYYANDAQLRDIVFLNPQWVTDTIYDILNYQIRDKIDNPGEFTREDAKRMLNEKGIGELTDTFLELMKKKRFELIFEKPNCLDEYIVPQYLPDICRDSKALEQLRPDSSIGFTINYPRFMPKSIFMRFMVQYGDLAANTYWKYGIVLGKKPSERVIAECHFKERQIKIQIADGINSKVRVRTFFDALWKLSDEKPEIEVSVNEKDFVEVGDLIDCLKDPEIIKIKSKQGNRPYIKDFLHLFREELPVFEEDKVKPTALPELMPESVTPEIFFSYAWDDDHETGESREKIVDVLYDDLKNDGYQVVRDKMDLGYKGLISEFMKRIGKGDIVIVAISDKYLKSPYCMYELLEIYRHARLEKDEFIKVVFPIRVESLALNKPNVLGGYYEYWENQEKEWKALISKHRVNKSQTDTYDKVCKIHNDLGDLIGHLTDMNALTKDLLSANNFAQIKEAIKARI
jgi:internalin A